MANGGQYVRQRSGVYQYERRVPLAVLRTAAQSDFFGSKKLFRRSLGTSDRSFALAKAAIVNEQFEAAVKMILGSGSALTAQGTAIQPRSVTDGDLQELCETFSHLVSRSWREQMLLAASDEDARDHLQDMIHIRETNAEDIQQSIASNEALGERDRRHSPVREARQAIKQRGLDAPAGSRDFGLVVSAIRKGMTKGQRLIDDILDGSVLPSTKDTYQRPAAQQKPRVTIRQAVYAYLEAKKGKVKPRTEQEVLHALRSFENAIGNRTLLDISRDDVVTFIGILAKKEVGGRSAGGSGRPISVSTIQKTVRMLGAAINYAMRTTTIDFLGPNPMLGQGEAISDAARPTDRRKMPDKRRFYTNEINLVFEHPWFTGCSSATNIHQSGTHRLAGAHYWASVLALYSGCRANELGGLKVDEVRLDDAYPHLLIRENEYRPTKNGEERQVPVLDALLNLGFRKYVESVATADGARLFPDWKPPVSRTGFDPSNARWSNADPVRAFNRTVVRMQLGGLFPEDSRLPVTFHSFRGAFKALISLHKYRLPQNYVNEIIGHAKSDLDRRYEGTIPIEETYAAVRECDYDTIVIPPAPK